MSSKPTVSVTYRGDNNSIAVVSLCSPPNAFGTRLWKEYREAFEKLSHETTVRCIVVRADGKFFTVGLDLKDPEQAATLMGSGEGESAMDTARKAYKLQQYILELQDTFTVMEKCPQPVITCIHGACIGAGIDLILAADIRLATKDAWFTIKEVDIGLAADVGTLQRIEKCTGNASLVRELAYTARRFEADEALKFGMLSRVFNTREELEAYAFDLASQISKKSPVGIFGTKANLLYSRDHSVKESLSYMATWNAAMLQTEDVGKAAMASLTKGDQPDFSKL